MSVHGFRFVYTDEVHLNADNVLPVLYTAKKYIITNLAKKCSEFLEENLSADTAPNLLEQSIMFDEKHLKDKVLIKIEHEASAVLSSEDFTKLSKEALCEVLQLNLQISSEMEVFEACMQWAENKCQQLQITTNGTNLREVLGDNLFLIRFPTMTGDDINDSVLPRDILTTYEGLQIFRYLTVRSKPENLPFSIAARFQFDPTPRSLLIPEPYVQLHGSIEPGSFCIKETILNCTVSRPVKIKKIFIHEFRYDACMVVTLTQNGKTLFNSPSMPTGSVVDAQDVSVEAGHLLVDILMSLLNPSAFFDLPHIIQASSPTARKLCDKFVSIDFSPVAENLLRGIEYSLI